MRLRPWINPFHKPQRGIPGRNKGNRRKKGPENPSNPDRTRVAARWPSWVARGFTYAETPESKGQVSDDYHFA